MKRNRRLAELMELHLDQRLDKAGRLELEIMLLEDADWAPVVDQLNLALH